MTGRRPHDDDDKFYGCDYEDLECRWSPVEVIGEDVRLHVVGYFPLFIDEEERMEC